MKYTVLLLRPDYIADEFGKDCFTSQLEADSPAQAEVFAQKEAAEIDGFEGLRFADYHVLAVYAGHLDNLATGS